MSFTDEDLTKIRAFAESSTPGVAYGVYPGGSDPDEQLVELGKSLSFGVGEIYCVCAPLGDGTPIEDAAQFSAITGNGPTSEDNAKFYSLARELVISLVDEVRIQRSVAELPRGDRDQRQAVAMSWGRAAFGELEATSLPQRGLRLLEESIETYQAAGGDVAMAHKLLDFVFARPPGALAQEIGGVGITLLVLAEAAGLSAELSEIAELQRILSKPTSHFAERNAAKNAAGFRAEDKP